MQRQSGGQNVARIRSIKPDFWTDEKIVELSFQARLLFIGLWNFADDDGRMVYSPKRIKMQIFPSDSLDVSELIGEIQRNSMVVTYAFEGAEYLQILNFAKHQKIDRRNPSRLPAPPIFTESPRLPPTPTDIRRASTESPPIAPTEGKGREGIKEGNGREKANGSQARHASKDETPVIQTLPLREGGDFEVRQSLVSELEPLYPKVDITATVREMKGWLVGNPDRQKTRKGIRRFIVNWLQSEQQKAEAH